MLKKIRINRAKWRTGEGGIYSTGIGDNCLVNDDYNKCCLGFISCQVYKGKLDNIINCGMPMELPFHVKYLNKERKFESGQYRFVNTDLSISAQGINDDYETTPQEKEVAIKALFKDTYDIEFFGKFNYTPETDKGLDDLSDREKRYLRDYVWSKL